MSLMAVVVVIGKEITSGECRLADCVICDESISLVQRLLPQSATEFAFTGIIACQEHGIMSAVTVVFPEGDRRINASTVLNALQIGLIKDEISQMVAATLEAGSANHGWLN